MPQKIEISADQRQQAYDFYIHHPAMSFRAIADVLGVSPPTFLRLRKEWGWPARDEAGAQKNVALTEGHAPTPYQGATSPLKEAALSLAQVARSQIDALVKEQRTKRVLDHDKAARTLASYAKTLSTAQALLEQEGSRLDETGHHDESPGASTNSGTSLLATLSGLWRRRRLAEAITSWAEAEIETVLRHWPLRCRSEQRPPGFGSVCDPWTVWLMLGGRGAGKTRTGSEWVRGIALGEPGLADAPMRRIALIGETFADARNVMVEGPAGILAVHARHERPAWSPSLRKLE